MDDLLGVLLVKAMIDDKAVGDEEAIEDREAFGALLEPEKPLSAFGARITAAYYLGLIGKSEWHNLKLIKDIRNAFAHGLHEISFDSQWVIGKCGQLEFPENSTVPGRTYSAFQKFVVAVRVVEFELMDRIEDMPEPPRVAREIAWQLTEGHLANTLDYVE